VWGSGKEGSRRGYVVIVVVVVVVLFSLVGRMVC